MKLLFDYPIIDGYYISKRGNPYDAVIVRIDDKFEETLVFTKENISKNEKYTISVDGFFKNYKWISEENVKRFLKQDIMYPKFSINMYNVYNIDDRWIIIPKSDGNPDFEQYTKYLSLSMGLIEHDL